LKAGIRPVQVRRFRRLCLRKMNLEVWESPGTKTASEWQPRRSDVQSFIDLGFPLWLEANPRLRLAQDITQRKVTRRETLEELGTHLCPAPLRDGIFG